jgi:hypothetical protein
MLYPKIQTIFKRDDKGNILPEQITKPEFVAVKDWTYTEKIDGMNMRVIFKKNDLGNWEVSFGGKTDNAQIPVNLQKYLKEHFTDKADQIGKYFEAHDSSARNVIIYGEGYGAGIQKGSAYSKAQKLLAFDMWIDGWWLEPLHAKNICDELDIPFVPVLEFATVEEAIAFVKSKPKTHLAPEIDMPMGELRDATLSQIHDMEGIVASSRPLMLFRDGTPIKWKLKDRDYR